MISEDNGESWKKLFEIEGFDQGTESKELPQVPKDEVLKNTAPLKLEKKKRPIKKSPVESSDSQEKDPSTFLSSFIKTLLVLGIILGGFFILKKLNLIFPKEKTQKTVKRPRPHAPRKIILKKREKPRRRTISEKKKKLPGAEQNQSKPKTMAILLKSWPNGTLVMMKGPMMMRTLKNIVKMKATMRI
jgi:hypothetical protein